MKTGTVTLNEVIEALKFLGGEATSRKIENYIIDSRGGILPRTYEVGSWTSYRETINQVIQVHCKRYKKHRGPDYFEYLRPRYYRLINFKDSNNLSLIESREIDSHKFAHKTKIDEKQLDELLQKHKEIGSLGEEKVLEYEKRYLIENGRMDLANSIRQISKQSVSEGYDIVSYDLDGNKKFIEVKSSHHREIKFYITDNELATAKSLKESFWIYRVIFVNENSFEIIQTQNPSLKFQSGEWILNPLAYLVQGT